VTEEMRLRVKKGKNFKEVIAEEKKKGRYTKLVMKRLTSLSTSLLYSCAFLLVFVAISAAVYSLFEPTVFIWAGILVLAALVSSIFASKITHLLKKQQWKYSSM
jgi:membrane protein YdbS with pleckstrin-like domain